MQEQNNGLACVVAAIDGTPVRAYLYCPGQPFFNDRGTGQHLYLQAEVEEAMDDFFGIYEFNELDRDTCSFFFPYYNEQREDGALAIEALALSDARPVELSPETVSGLISWARRQLGLSASASAAPGPRARLSGLAAQVAVEV